MIFAEANDNFSSFRTFRCSSSACGELSTIYLKLPDQILVIGRLTGDDEWLEV